MRIDKVKILDLKIIFAFLFFVDFLKGIEIISMEGVNYVGSIVPMRDSEAIVLIGVGDFNGDGYDDIVAAGGKEMGGLKRIYIFYGGADFDSLPDLVIDNRVFGVAPDSFSVSRNIVIWDYNNDGFDDLVAPIGKNFMFEGSPNGLSLSYRVVLPRYVPEVEWETRYFRGFIDFEGSGDIDGDGYRDLLALVWMDCIGGGRIFRPFLYIYRGGYLDTIPSYVINLGDEVLFGDILYFYPLKIFFLGDINGDGYGDYAISDPYFPGAWPNYPFNWGVVRVYLGGNPPDSEPFMVLKFRDDPYIREFEGFAQFGESVRVCEIEGEKYLVVGSPGWDEGKRGGSWGKVYFYRLGKYCDTIPEFEWIGKGPLHNFGVDISVFEGSVPFLAIGGYQISSEQENTFIMRGWFVGNRWDWLYDMQVKVKGWGGAGLLVGNVAGDNLPEIIKWGFSPFDSLPYPHSFNRILVLGLDLKLPRHIFSVYKNVHSGRSLYNLLRGKSGLEIFDVSGRKIKTFVKGLKESGIYEFKVNGFKKGVYFLRLKGEKAEDKRKIIILK